MNNKRGNPQNAETAASGQGWAAAGVITRKSPVGDETMRFICPSGAPGNPSPNRFDGSQANDANTTRLLAVLASVASDHTRDKLARQMLRNATAELFDAAARLDSLAQCGGRQPSALLEAAVAHA